MMKKERNKEFVDVLFQCSCGFSSTIHCHQSCSKTEILHVPICMKCHSITTGQSKIIDDEGRVARFMDRYDKNKTL